MSELTLSIAEAGDRDSLQAVAAEVASPRQTILAALDAIGLTPGMCVLDAGCGSGAHLPLFAECVAPGGIVRGIDLDAGDVALARQINRDQIANGIVQIVQGDVLGLPFGDDEFDVAWSSSVLHHLEVPAAMLAELARVTRPGGLVAIIDSDLGNSFPSLPWPIDLEERVRAAVWRAAAENYGKTLPYHFDGHIGRKLPRLLREAGLIDIRLHAFSDVDRAPLSASRKAAIRDWLLGPFDERLRDFLAPRDLRRFHALFDLDAPDAFLHDPDFFLIRTILLAVGQQPA